MARVVQARVRLAGRNLQQGGACARCANGASASDPAASSPFFLASNRLAVYDVTSSVRVLGEGWLSAACDVIRSRREHVSHDKEWLSRFVAPFCEFVWYLQWFSEQHDDNFPAWREIPGRWEEALQAYRRRLLRGGMHGDSTQFGMRDYVIRLLAGQGVLPPGSGLLQKEWRTPVKDINFDIARPPPPLPQPRFVFLVGSRLFDCRPYAELGGKFVQDFGRVVADQGSEYEERTARPILATARSFLGFLLEHRGQPGLTRLYEALALGERAQLSSDDWEVVAHAWREKAKTQLTPKGRPRALITADMDVGRLRVTWELLAAEGIVQHIELPGFKGAGRKGLARSRPGLAQLNTSATVPEKLNRFIEHLEPADRAPALDFIRALSAYIGQQAVSELTTDGLAEAIMALNDNRLATIRTHAEKAFMLWRKHWERGQQLLAKCRHSSGELVRLLDTRSLSGKRRAVLARELFKAPAGNEALSNLLRYFMDATGGRAMRASGPIGRAAVSLGGRPAVQAYLHPHGEVTLALCLLLMVDSGANVEVVRETPFHCWGAGKDDRQREVRFGVKNRAGGKRITDFLDLCPQQGQLISSVQALEQYLEMTQGMRKLAPASVAASLFLVFGGRGRVMELASYRLGAWLEAFINRRPELKAFRFTATSIRVSVLLAEHYHHPNGLPAAQLRGDHANAQTTYDSYSGSYPNQLVYNQMIREFGERFQAIVIVTIDGSAAKLGMSQKDLDWLVSDAARTGLGFSCLNPKAGIQPGTRPGQSCTEFQNCAECSVRWVVATVDNIVDMILTNEHLRRQQAELVEVDFDLWERRWLKTLAFTEVALRKLAMGETASVFAAAKKAASDRRPTYRPFPLM